MNKKNITDERNITEPTGQCQLELSADGNWLRLVIDEKQIVSFHVNYVQKILNPTKDATPAKRKSPTPDVSPTF